MARTRSTNSSKPSSSLLKRKARPLIPQKPAGAPAMLKLPVELQCSVVAYLTSVQDLKRLCLVCKELRAIATPSLYHTVTLSLCRLNDGLKQSFHAANPGLLHIRKLKLITAHGAYRHSRHGRPLSHLLQSLPQDGLTTFSLNTSAIVPMEVAYILRLRQRRLTNLVLHHVNAAPIVDYLPDAEELQHVTTLRLYLSSAHDSPRASRLVKAAPRVCSLTLALPDPLDEFESGVDAEYCRNSIEAIFAPWLNSHDDAKAEIKHLCFENFVFTACAPLVAAALAPDILANVALVRCANTNMLMEHLRRENLVLSSFVDERKSDDEEAHGMLQTFLMSFRGLQRLRLSTRADSVVFADCNWSAIERHGATLRSLFVDDFELEVRHFYGGHYDRTMTAFRTLMARCASLRQLAIRAPDPDDTSDAQHTFSSFLDCLETLPDLRTLRLFIYVQSLDNAMEEEDIYLECSHEQELQRFGAKVQVQELANKIFAQLFPFSPDLVALVIDARFSHAERVFGDDCLQFGFLRVLQRDLYGQTVAAAVACEPTDIRLHEPCCEILDDNIMLHYA